MSDPNINNKELKCERCQTEEVAIICQTCHPFHNFCNHCDSIIHSMKLKTNHIREPIYNTIENQNKQVIPPSERDSVPPKINQRSLTPDRQFFRFPKNNDIYNPSIYNLNTYDPEKNNSNYSNNYINEIYRINEKEKDAMKYKIDSLQTYIEKLKLNFQNELKTVEDKANQYLREKKLLEEKINQIIDGTLKEKNLKISIITQENEALKEKINILEEQIKEKNIIIKKKEKEYNNYINNLKDEISTIRNSNTNMQKNHMNKISEMVKSNDDNIKNIQEMHKKEIYDIYIDSKTKNDKLIQQVQNDYNTIEMLKNNNNNLQQLVQKLENNNHILLHKNQELKNKNTALINNLKSSHNINEKLKKNMEKIKIENNNMKSDFDYFEYTINGLKNEIILMNETYAKKDKDFNYLLTQSEKIRKEFSDNIFNFLLYKNIIIFFIRGKINNEELDSKNRELIKENEELKRALLSFQETINF